MPVIYLLNVSKHNLVFSFHVIRNSIFSNPGHVALHTHVTAFTLILYISNHFYYTIPTKSTFTHLNDQTELPHIVPLGLHQFQQDVAKEIHKGHVTLTINDKEKKRDLEKALITYCRLLRKPVLRSSISSIGEDDDSRELSDGLKEVLLLSACSTDRELGLSSRAY